jgi:hypothetical protein
MTTNQSLMPKWLVEELSNPSRTSYFTTGIDSGPLASKGGFLFVSSEEFATCLEKLSQPRAASILFWKRVDHALDKHPEKFKAIVELVWVLIKAPKQFDSWERKSSAAQVDALERSMAALRQIRRELEDCGILEFRVEDFANMQIKEGGDLVDKAPLKDLRITALSDGEPVDIGFSARDFLEQFRRRLKRECLKLASSTPMLESQVAWLPALTWFTHFRVPRPQQCTRFALESVGLQMTEKTLQQAVMRFRKAPKSTVPK